MLTSIPYSIPTLALDLRIPIQNSINRLGRMLLPQPIKKPQYEAFLKAVYDCWCTCRYTYYDHPDPPVELLLDASLGSLLDDLELNDTLARKRVLSVIESLLYDFDTLLRDKRVIPFIDHQRFKYLGLNQTTVVFHH